MKEGSAALRLGKFLRKAKDGVAMRGYEARRIWEKTRRHSGEVLKEVKSGFVDAERKAAEERLEPVKIALSRLPSDRIKGLLNSRSVANMHEAATNERVIVVPVNEFFGSTPAVQIGDMSYVFYGVCLTPKSVDHPLAEPRQNALADEVISVMKGYGLLKTKEPGENTEWRERPIYAGQTHIIQKGHSSVIVNGRREPLDLLLATPDTSLAPARVQSIT